MAPTVPSKDVAKRRKSKLGVKEKVTRHTITIDEFFVSLVNDEAGERVLIDPPETVSREVLNL